MSTITTRHLGAMLFESELGSHRLQIDVPLAMGGSDRGPRPPEVFIASLGSCIGAFIAKYCEQAGIDTEGMTVDVSFDKVEHPTRLTNLQAVVTLPCSDCKGREEALERVARQCIIHETMTMFEGLEVHIVAGKAEEEIPLAV